MKVSVECDACLLRCGECGGAILPGQSYWRVNGHTVCRACLPDFACGELEPFRRVRGEEMTFS